MKKLILISIGVLIVVASLGWNAYSFGTSWLNKERVAYYNLGVSNIRNSIVTTLDAKGEVPISSLDPKTGKAGPVRILVEKDK